MRQRPRDPTDAPVGRGLRPGRPVALAGLCAALTLSCSPPASPPAEPGPGDLHRVSLPLSADARASLSGQRVAFANEFLLSDVYLASRGRWTLAAGGPLYIPTEVAPPGRQARDLARQNRERVLEVSLPAAPYPALPAGTAIAGVQGVLGSGEQAGRLALDRLPDPGTVAWPDPPPAAGTALRVVSFNLENFFNGDGRGGGFPTERGADSPAEFAAQSERIRATFEAIAPDLAAVQELENDGFGPHSAAQSLVRLLDGSHGGGWAAVDPGVGPVGGDVITVGLFYRRARLEPVGAAQVFDARPFQGLSRQPLAQRFRERASGAEFWVVVNHLKSKGACPETGPNRDDGQGCWNRARTDAVQALTAWLDSLAESSGTRRVMVLGDMNAWRQEDPIRAFREAGYRELVEARSGLPQHSFRYFGQAGTLDYAFANPELLPRAQRAFIWHINADMPRNMDLPRPWLRSSDHDPVIVDFDFSQAATSD